MGIPPTTNPDLQTQATAALVVARFATNLVDAQGAEAAIVHEPIEVLIWSGETVELMRDDLIQFSSVGKRKNKKHQVNKNSGNE